jgi:hypothetical protein
LEFLSRNPFAEDIVPASVGSIQVQNSLAGSYTTFGMSYWGHAFGSPKCTITWAAGQPGKINYIGWSNTGSGEQVYCDFTLIPGGGATFDTHGVLTAPGGLSSGGGHVIVFDGDNSVITLDGNPWPINGPGFPQIYPNPAGSAPTVNNFQIYTKMIGATTSPASLMASISYTAKYEF